MRRKLRVFNGLLCVIVFSEVAAREIPQVPQNLEVAGIKLKITAEAREDIQRDVDALHASEKYYGIKLDRVNLYFPVIERILKEENVPDDIKYLSIQESALVSDAVSSADAVGYWQFKDFTAREVGLRVDKKVDERKNIVSSTIGAARYFKKNNFYFKNWIYSVSAYQAGAGGAKKYVDPDYYGSDKLTIDRKSHWYVKRFIAHVVAFREDVGRPHSEGLRLLEYRKGSNKDLDQIAKELNVEGQLLKEYNKWLLHGKIPEDKAYTVVFPVKGRAPRMDDPIQDRPVVYQSEGLPVQTTFPAAIKDDLLGLKKPVFLKINGIQGIMAGKGDDLNSLASKAELKPLTLEKYNDLNPRANIVAGEVYYIHKKKNRSPIRYHVVQYDESFWEISQRYGIRMKSLLRKNRMAASDPLKPGRVLWLHKRRPGDIPEEYRPVSPKVIPKKVREPVVARVDPEPVRIAEEKPKAVEEKVEPKTEPVVQRETTPELQTEIPPASTMKKTEEMEGEVHVVSPEETLYSISRKYGVKIESLLTLNGLDMETPLRPGQKMMIPEEEKPLETVKNPEMPKKGKTYTVQAGDSLYKIARYSGLTVEELVEINKKASTELSIGEVLIIEKK